MRGDVLVVEVGEATAYAAVEDSAATNCECSICTNGEATEEKRVGLGYFVILELVVGNDSSSTAGLISKNTVFQCRDWSIGACLPLYHRVKWESCSGEWITYSLENSTLSV